MSKEKQEEISRIARIKAKKYLADHGYDVSGWDAENSIADVYGEVSTPQGETINIVIRSARGKKRYILQPLHLRYLCQIPITSFLLTTVNEIKMRRF